MPTRGTIGVGLVALALSCGEGSSEKTRTPGGSGFDGAAGGARGSGANGQGGSGSAGTSGAGGSSGTSGASGASGTSGRGDDGAAGGVARGADAAGGGGAGAGGAGTGGGGGAGAATDAARSADAVASGSRDASAGAADARPPTIDARPPPPVDAAPPPPDTGGPPGADPEPGRLAGMTRAQNQVRAEIPVPPLTWDRDIAATAQAYANKCMFQHSNTPGLGENLAAFAPPEPTRTGIAAVNGWAAERAYYNYASNTCAAGKMCGHYTQIVWKSTTRVGCGFAVCSTNSPWGQDFPDWELWVCNYAPPGNIIGQRPY